VSQPCRNPLHLSHLRVVAAHAMMAALTGRRSTVEVQKSLCRAAATSCARAARPCELATMQTTATDQAAGLANLIAMPARASAVRLPRTGQVCAAAEIADPERMGAAPTCARLRAVHACGHSCGYCSVDDRGAPNPRAERRARGWERRGQRRAAVPIQQQSPSSCASLRGDADRYEVAGAGQT
jgi:hypothetical protein